MAQYSIPTGGDLHMKDKMSRSQGVKPPIDHSVTHGIAILSAKPVCQLLEL